MSVKEQLISVLCELILIQRPVQKIKLDATTHRISAFLSSCCAMVAMTVETMKMKETAAVRHDLREITVGNNPYYRR